jgi:excisionase family DNA binding protein
MTKRKNHEPQATGSGTPPQEFIDIPTAAGEVWVSDATIRRMLTQGRLKRFKFGSRTLIRRSELLNKIVGQ